MSRVLTHKTNLEGLRKQAKSWLKGIRAGDPQAVARLRSAGFTPSATPGLRHVQHALARERPIDAKGWQEHRRGYS